MCTRGMLPMGMVTMTIPYTVRSAFLAAAGLLILRFLQSLEY